MGRTARRCIRSGHLRGHHSNLVESRRPEINKEHENARNQGLLDLTGLERPVSQNLPEPTLNPEPP